MRKHCAPGVMDRVYEGTAAYHTISQITSHPQKVFNVNKLHSMMHDLVDSLQSRCGEDTHVYIAHVVSIRNYVRKILNFVELGLNNEPSAKNA